ncbi:hypothetical protein [Actinomyces massiliensis]|uniref:hypothetical protein n=1 Tax=Actinomyces massiliensis TaxID=461393 RepID=UPI0002EF1D9D|nr:hypothetical protein [Actinomyces massiliensis]
MHDSNTTPGHEPDDRDRPEADHDSADGIGTDAAGTGGAAPQHDIDAEFAAMMEGLALPSEMQADLESMDSLDSLDSLESLESLDEPGPSVVSVDDVPHNTYTAPKEPLTGGGQSDQRIDRDGPDSDQGADAESPASSASPATSPSTASDAGPAEPASSAPPRAVKVAVVLTPLASADALAAMCAMSDLECTVVPARSGAFAVKEFVSAHAEWDVSELLGGADTEPAEAADLASALSRLSRAGVVLLTADLATDVGIESGLSGTITARRYVDGKAGEDAAAGLLLASVDQEVEDVLLGIASADGIEGALKSSEVKTSRAMRWLARGLRRPRGGKS